MGIYYVTRFVRLHALAREGGGRGRGEVEQVGVERRVGDLLARNRG